MGAEIFTESHTGMVLGAYAALNLLVLFLLDHWLCNSSFKYRNSVARRVIVCFLYITVAFLPVLSLLIRDSLYKYYLERYSYIWLGFMMYFGALILIATFFEVIVRLIVTARKDRNDEDDFDDEEKEPAVAPRVISGVLLVAMIAASVGINVYGMKHARETVVTHYDVKIDKHVKSRDTLRAAFISDLHLSYNSDVGMIRQMVDKLNREKPDIVFVGGDMFTSSYKSVLEPEEYIKALKGIKAKEGVYWVYGNHDVEEPLFCGFPIGDPKKAERTKQIKKFLKKSGFKILDDKCAAISKGEIQLVGRADEYKPVDRAEKRMAPDVLMEDIDKDKPVIVLAHEPDDFGDLAAEGGDILFSGHTHGGQIFPGNIIVDMMLDVVYGMKDRNGLKVIVSSGVGCYGPPIRVLTNSEIVIADIHFSK